MLKEEEIGHFLLVAAVLVDSNPPTRFKLSLLYDSFVQMERRLKTLAKIAGLFLLSAWVGP